MQTDHQTEMLSFLGFASATGKRGCGPRLLRKCTKHSAALIFIILLLSLLHSVVVTHRRKQISASLYVKILKSGAIDCQGSKSDFH